MIKVIKEKLKGQIEITYIVGWGIVIIAAVISGVMANGKITDSKVEKALELTNQNYTANVQRISKLEEAIITIKDDNKQIKTDIKDILKILK
jgi:cell division protein FtsN